MQDTINAIAAKVLKIETLETRNIDSLDFHDLAIWQVKQGLQEAYNAGREQGHQDTMEVAGS